MRLRELRNGKIPMCDGKATSKRPRMLILPSTPVCDDEPAVKRIVHSRRIVIRQKVLVMTVENQTPTHETIVNEYDQSGENAVQESPNHPIVRRGDIGKCPICGSSVDPDAYHCATCRNYYCFHCRARLLPSDPQLECVNQDCGYYGKLICGVCDGLQEKKEAPLIYSEPVDGYWPFWLGIAFVAGLFAWYFTTLWFGFFFAILVFAAGGTWLQKNGFNIFGTESMVTHERSSTYRTCIRCQQPAKEIKTEASAI
jgi:hypothetical protein